MGSGVPIEIVEEDGDFDWEAAVREIDLACLKKSNASSSLSNLITPSITGNGTTKPPAKRQSTLDKFIGRTEYKPPPENHDVSDTNFECGNEKSPCVAIDPEAAKTWIYPVNANVPLRDYQFAITKTALFSNTLVALPTGLGKTLIAAVVMYNYFRWFPEGKIVFAAPSRPLVMQQIQACHNIVGIPQEWTIDLTGQTCPSKRAFLWKSKRVFFVTPQVLEKDIQSGTCLTNYLVCLVIDEAHRALGNYSYCVVLRELMAVPVQLRILALTATPGSKIQAIQGIIDNLQISTLEYRNESDHDVCPYVHDRKLERIEQVPLGQDADEVSKRLSDVIRPYAVRLKNFKVNLNLDYQTLSPHAVLMARDDFRRAPPPAIPHVNHGDVESCFSALITLCHIRKLLSSHGIRPAYEMLEEKLQQGLFARLMSKNEDIRKTKLLMQQSLSHGAPNPKLLKMLEILTDHFKVKDPKTSRVIIFSNFRGSVRDIMDALSNIGDVVKATEFIGQSSGKTLKGQSQKVQQAVLEKFRAGAFNVIVATSIAEEGLDIMEVDLVICFDANVSPLRMIQRMGRTGRKNNGRVVVLACEGSELKSYMQKQAKGRAIKKHMRNGGTNSFNFHPSPRMVPHVYKPEVQHVEFSIKKFIPRGKKLQDETATETPAFKKELTPAETDMLAKYYETDEEKLRVSLIAFPHFQTLPSKVHKVMHSRQTGMLIDAMQLLQEENFAEQSKSFFSEFGAPLGEREELNPCLRNGDDPEDLPSFRYLDANTSQRKAKRVESPTSTLETSEKDYENPSPTHRYLFGSECASVDTLGKVFVMPVPRSFFSNVPRSDYMPLAETEKQHSSPSRSHIDFVPIDTSAKHEQDNKLCREFSPDGANKTLETHSLVKRHSTSVCKGDVENSVGEIVLSSDEEDCEGLELSPRLTNFINSGVVPESPIYEQENAKEVNKEEDPGLPGLSSPMRFSNELAGDPSSPGTKVQHKCSDSHIASTTNDVRTPEKEKGLPNGIECMDVSPIPEEWRTPLANLTNTNSNTSKDWRVDSGEKSETRQPRKLKRLRRLGDCSSAVKDNNPGIAKADHIRSYSRSKKHIRGKKKRSADNNAQIFIDAEAEVSSEAGLSDDENVDMTGDSFEDSFIDDGTMPTANTQAESGKVDMMGIYRRSLLSQSPFPARFRDLGGRSPYSAGHLKSINESRSDSGKSSSSLRTPQTTNSESNQDAMDIGDVSVVHISSESHKRKFSSCNLGNTPVINLESKFEAQAQATENESHEGVRRDADAIEYNNGEEDDDDDAFFATLDFDAMEAQATMLLSKQKSEAKKEDGVVKPHTAGMERSDHGVEKDVPSFDLGLW